jgi:TolB-like protein/DNA-binding winged helix-turn-helix (wHTH) protein/Flp pilus assembly protein TadD
MPEETQDVAVRRFGVFEINLHSGELRKNGMRLRLSGQPFQVLALLVEHAGEVVTREELHSQLWPNTFVDFDHGLNNTVARIREVLDDSSDTPRYVQTIARRGYRFIAPLADARPAIVSLATAESKISPPHEITGPGATGPSDGAAEKRFLSTRLTVLLTGAAVIASFAVGFVLYRSTVKSTGRLAIKSLAVLPLKNLSGDANQEYLADGITEEVIGKLASLSGVRVISRTSSMHFKETKLVTPEIAKALGVDALVEGSVIRDDNHIRVHAQLIRGASDEHFWSETYDREIGDVLRLESEVAQSIAERVEITVTGHEQARLATARHISPEVYETYLKGKLGLHNTSADMKQTREYFEEAIRKDPTFAPAYVGLARTHYDMGTLLGVAPPGQTRPKAIAAARKALELDPDIAEAHALIAEAYQQQWQWADAEKEYERALNLKPNDAAANMGFAKWLAVQGRIDEAIAWARRGRVLDPLGVAGVESGWVLFCARRYDEAIREMKGMLTVRPDLGKARWYLGFALIAKGQPEQAVIELEKLAAITNRSPGSLEELAMAYGFAGRRAEALRVIDELKRRGKESYVPAAALIDPYLGLHDYDAALAGFERAYQEQSNILQWVKVQPFFDPLRGNPRFEDLVRRVSLK